MNDGAGLAETIILLLVAAVVLVASYQFWRRPSVPRAIWPGCPVRPGCADEGRAVVPVVAVLVPWRSSSDGESPRTALAGRPLGTLTAIVVIAPWVGFNLSRFTDPVLHVRRSREHARHGELPARLYFGHILGARRIPLCDPIKTVPGDESVQNSARSAGRPRHLARYPDRRPMVVAARVGRGVRTVRTALHSSPRSTFDHRPLPDRRSRPLHVLGLVVGAITGALALRRRG